MAKLWLSLSGPVKENRRAGGIIQEYSNNIPSIRNSLVFCGILNLCNKLYNVKILSLIKHTAFYPMKNFEFTNLWSSGYIQHHCVVLCCGAYGCDWDKKNNTKENNMKLINKKSQVSIILEFTFKRISFFFP